MLKKTSKFISFWGIILLTAITISKYAEGIEIGITGFWDLIIDDRYFTWEGGLQDIYESDKNQINLEISDSDGGNWKLDVRRSDTNWHSDFVLKLKRRMREVTVETTSREFFTGRGDSSYSIQMILEGVSLQISPDIYVTTIIYTIAAE